MVVGPGASASAAGEAARELAVQILDRLRAGGHTVAVAESLTGGLVAAALTDIPGSSAAFRGGADQESGPIRPIAPPGINTQTPIPGVAQTPGNQQGRDGNVDLTDLVKWAARLASLPVREHPLEISAAGTGGLYQGTVRDKSISTAIDRIGDELHGSYTLSYRPLGTDPHTYHEIKVTVDRPGLKVRTRLGYYPR